ncbi:MAG: polyprenyl synthetase family protein [Cephaloticoccus sp.]
MTFAEQLAGYVARVEIGLDAHLPRAGDRPARLHEAMRYAGQGGGKRLRPVLVLAAAELFGRTQADASPAGQADALPAGRADALPAAVALECVHTYSLVHDDLPCMDDDDLRRGRATTHKAFDEATALLAGDALLTHAFVLLTRAYAGQPALAHALCRELAEAAGSHRLIGGQMADLQAEKKANASAEELEFIHLNKTAAMLEAALVMGGLAGGANEDDLSSLRLGGRHLGLAFQIVDDVLDATADTATLGKTAGKDAKADKTTYVKLHGIETARRLAAAQTDKAVAALQALPGDTSFLIALVRELCTRGK